MAETIIINYKDLKEIILCPNPYGDNIIKCKRDGNYYAFCYIKRKIRVVRIHPDIFKRISQMTEYRSFGEFIKDGCIVYCNPFYDDIKISYKVVTFADFINRIYDVKFVYNRRKSNMKYCDKSIRIIIKKQAHNDYVEMIRLVVAESKMKPD